MVVCSGLGGVRMYRCIMFIFVRTLNHKNLRLYAKYERRCFNDVQQPKTKPDVVNLANQYQ